MYIYTFLTNDLSSKNLISTFQEGYPRDDPRPLPNETFDSDNEGFQMWPQLGKIIDTVNIMAYDAGRLPTFL